MSLRVRVDRVVTLAYEIRDDQGNEIEIRSPESPALYIHGRGQLLSEVEAVLEGKTPGFSTTVRLEARQAYGEYQPELAIEMPREAFPQGQALDVGMKFDTVGPDGKPLVVRVTAVDSDVVTLDGNHPLAGISLLFEVRVLDVREASEEEKQTSLVSKKDRSELH
ncbi:MAG: peptidylprolyl isomerase [Bdellovibrionaceae bacterium]|nr:peptidylprolyl isomerase [Pseudobdellovibrionaceae bacterium]